MEATKEVLDFCCRFGISVEQFYGKEVIKGDLYLNYRGLNSLPDGFNPTVCGSFDLSHNQLTVLPDGFNPTVSMSLLLQKNLLTELPYNFNPTVGCSLDLHDNQLKELPNGFNPTVGWHLDLRDNQIKELPNGFNPKVRGYVNVDEHLQEQVKYTKLQENYIFSWMGGKYIKIDGIFCEVLEHKGLVWKCKYLIFSDIFYVVTDGNGNYAHGVTIKEAKTDLIYKISDRDISSYEILTLDSVLSFEEAIECYRVITGACSFGTKDFCINKLDEIKDTYTIKEMIELTKGQYGNESFKEFFK